MKKSEAIRVLLRKLTGVTKTLEEQEACYVLEEALEALEADEHDEKKYMEAEGL